MTTPKPPAQLWHVKIGARKIKVYWPHDPTRFQTVRPLTGEQRKTFELFLERLKELKNGRHWRVSVVFIPDNEELFANLANSDSSFHDLDPRRLEALRICRAVLGACEDLAPYLFERVVAQGKNPFLTSDRHFSLFGNQIVAQHYVAITRVPSVGTVDQRRD